MMLNRILFNLKNLGVKPCYNINGNIYTYEQTYKAVCNLYKYLIENYNKNLPILVYGSKEIYMPVSFLACSFAGFKYIPVDDSAPKNRVNAIIEDSNCGLILGDFEYDGTKNVSSNEIMRIVEQNQTCDIENVSMMLNDTYYIIFTSGTTGKPKGVEITYSNLNSCIGWLNEIMIEKSSCGQEVLLNQAKFSFDLSVADLYLSLYSGSLHFILDKLVLRDFTRLFTLLKESNVTLAVITPSFAEMLLMDKSFNADLLKGLRKIFFCGEVLTLNTINKLFDRFPNIEIINAYGPTECTVAVTSKKFTTKLSKDEKISIGVPKPNVNIYIVDEKLNEVRDGEKGEILISGESVGKGYINDNNDKYVVYKNVWSYLSGDIGYKRESEIFYCCRKDKQIKYMGYRIELEDIENSIYSLEYTDRVVIIPKLNESGKVERIIAFIKLKESFNFTRAKINDDLCKILPKYMIPSIIITDEISLNMNGKCDEKGLMNKYGI